MQSLKNNSSPSEFSHQTENPETTDKIIFSEEEINNIAALVTAIKKIRARLLKENVDLDFYRKILGIIPHVDTPENRVKKE